MTSDRANDLRRRARLAETERDQARTALGEARAALALACAALAKAPAARQPHHAEYGGYPHRGERAGLDCPDCLRGKAETAEREVTRLAEVADLRRRLAEAERYNEQLLAQDFRPTKVRLAEDLHHARAALAVQTTRIETARALASNRLAAHCGDSLAADVLAALNAAEADPS